MGRYSTVHDLGDLRLHPDGRRVERSAKNRSLRKARVTVRDSRDNWFAKDAGGVIEPILKSRRTVDAVENEPGSIDEWEAFDEVEGTTQTRRIDKRTAKRRKFAHDYSFLENPTQKSRQPGCSSQASEYEQDETRQTSLPIPSSDLLKSLHQLAAVYYFERGQLLNASKAYRAERKAKQLMKLSGKRRLSGFVPSKKKSSQAVEECQDDSESGRQSEEHHGTDSEPELSRNSRKRRKQKLQRDMYKVFDGSALMALGVYIQEQVASLLSPCIPEGWENGISEETDESLVMESEGVGGDIEDSKGSSGDDDEAEEQGVDDNDDEEQGEDDPGEDSEAATDDEDD